MKRHQWPRKWHQSNNSEGGALKTRGRQTTIAETACRRSQLPRGHNVNAAVPADTPWRTIIASRAPPTRITRALAAPKPAARVTLQDEWTTTMNSARFRGCWPMIALLAAVGCNSEQEPLGAVEQPFAGVELRLAVPFQTGLSEHWQGAIAEWQAQTGATVRLEELALPEDGPVTLAEANDGPTMGLVPATWVGELASRGRIAPIPESLINAEQGVRWSDLFTGLRENFAGLARRPSLIPISMPVLVCYYRADLLERAGLAPPETWADYQTLVDRLPEWAPSLAAVEPLATSFRCTMYLARAVNYARHHTHYSVFFDYETGEPMIDNPAFVRALEELLAAVGKMPPQVLQFTPADCRKEILEGRAALAVGFEPVGVVASADAVPRATAARGSDVAIGVCRLPGAREAFNPTRKRWEAAPHESVQHITLLAFEGYCLCAFSDAGKLPLQAAWNLARVVSRDDFATGYPEGMAGLCRESQLLNPSLFTGPELHGPEVADYLSAVSLALREPNAVAELPVPGRHRFLEALRHAIDAALARHVAPRYALFDAAGAWRALEVEIGRDRVCAGYRSVLGLSLPGKLK
jgi:multiple sugar transport system substrate-binding protein